MWCAVHSEHHTLCSEVIYDRETGTHNAACARPRQRTTSARVMNAIGIDLGGTKLSGAVFSPHGKILQREVLPVAGSEGPEVGKAIQEMIARLRAHQANLAGIGVAVPGISHATTGRVWAPNIPGWEDYPLRDELQSSVAESHIPITIDSDRACAILGESWLGAARGCTNAIFLAVGTGIGAGILADGNVVRGAHDIAGAIGWLALSRPFREPYVHWGCFEHHASGDGLARVARELLAAEPNYQGVLRTHDPSALTAQTIFELYPSGDRIAVKTLEQAVAYWGMAVANLVSLFNPEKVVFGGGVFGPAVQFLPQIRDEAERWAQPISMKRVSLEPSALGADAVLTGSAYLALRTRQGRQ